MTSRMFVCETFFKYRGPASKSGNSLFQCMKCPPNVLNKEGKEALLSCSDVSRNNLKKLNSKKLKVCEPLADALLKGIENRFNNYFFSDELRLASVIHPKFKFNWLSDGYSSEEEIDASKTGFIAELKRKIEIMIQADSKAISGAANNITGLDVSPIDPKDFFSPLKPISSQQQIFSPADDEISRFFQSKTTNDLRCLDSSFPYIRKLFIQLNTGLPSSAAVERLFSLGGSLNSDAYSTK